MDDILRLAWEPVRVPCWPPVRLGLPSAGVTSPSVSAPSIATTANQACLHCSPARTVWLRRIGANTTAGQASIIAKVYNSGSMADAEREFAMGRLAAGAGVVTYLQATTDTESNRPAVTLQFAAGPNLDALVAEHGALPATQALRLIASLAHTIARLHSLRSTELPRGMCHGDVKPQNVLVTDLANGNTLLLDFEHAGAIGTSDDRLFTGGTNAFSPPEAHTGKSPDAAFDVFGLGATLAFLLDGGTVRRLPRHPAVDALVMSCCAPEASARPSAADLAQHCEHLVRVLSNDPHEQHLHDWATGRCQTAPSDGDDTRSTLWAHRRRLLDRLPTLLQPPTELPHDPEGLQHALELVQRVLGRFPRNASVLARRQQLLQAIRQLLQNAAATIRSYHRKEQFEAALRWLRTTEALATTAMSVAGGLTAITRIEPATAPTNLQRAPIEFLQLLASQTQSAHAELQRRIDEICTAEQALDLAAAEQAIDAMASDYGGTSKTVAERRDQLHRLSFYLDRIARAETKVERIGPLWDPIALAPLQTLVSSAARALETSARREANSTGAVGLRSLQVTLTNIADEFPHLQQVQPALLALSQALLHLTEQAWQQLGDAEQRLTIVPVPVRPLQLALGRLDTFRMLEAFVDRKEQPRSELLDGIERLRLGLEQARSARDRLAENAESALARGHWTTGLFDMERAVERLNPGDETEHVEADRLRERLQAARRTKQEIETALRRNMDLLAKYTALEDDSLSTFEARVHVLQERRDCLMFLGLHVPSDRADLYRKDLRSVDTLLAVERAADAERRLDGLTDPMQRLRLARSTAESLGATGSPSDSGMELPGRLVRLQEHWRTVAAQCQRTVDLLQQQEQHKRRQRRRMLAIAIVAFVATSTAIGFAIKPWFAGEPAHAGERSAPQNSPNNK